MADKMNVESSVFQLPISITKNGTVTKTLATQDTYLDKNIQVSVTTPDADFEVKTAAAVTATVSTTDTTYTSDTKTDYPIVIEANATAGAVTVGTKTAGFTADTDTVTVASADAETDSKTIYIKAGTLSGTGSAGAESADIALTKVAAAPTDGSFYIKASGAGNVGVATAGWVDPDKTTKVSTDGDAYYTVKKAALANTGNTDSTELTTPVLTEGGYLYISEGYIKDTKISLASLVPDEATLAGTEDGKSDLMYKTVSAYDKDGKLIAGTMGDATLSAITASDAKATVGTVSIAANADSTAFTVTGSADISGSASVSVATRGLADTTLSQSGTVSGTASVDATIAKIGLAVETSGNDGVVTPVISKNDSTNAQTGDITTSAPVAGYYVAVNTSEIKEDVTIAAKVATAGYGTIDAFSKTDSKLTTGANASGTYYIPITSASHTVTKSASSVTAPVTTVTTAVNGGDVTPVTVAEDAKVTGVQYVKIAASATTSAGSVTTTAVCNSTEGYITALKNDIVTTEAVAVADASATAKYIKVYDGSILDEA